MKRLKGKYQFIQNFKVLQCIEVEKLTIEIAVDKDGEVLILPSSPNLGDMGSIKLFDELNK